MLSTWLSNKGILFYHIPNGGYRNRLEAYKLKQEGVQPGVPDICIPMPNKTYHGLYIELKKKHGGKLSEAQRYWLEQLKKQGYQAELAYGFEQAKDIVEKYLN